MQESELHPKTLVLIDGKSVFYRGFYAMPNFSTKDGIPTGGVYGFAVLALELFSRINPDYVIVAWDKAHTNIRRRKAIYDGYKAGRHAAPPEFYMQIPLLKELLGALNWPFYECDDYEADDIIGTLDLQAGNAGLNTIMISSDLDLLQLLDNNTELYAMKKGLANLEKFDVAAFSRKYGGLVVEQFADLKALKGDSSDNIPGVAGIGEKTAIDLLQKFSTLDNVFANLDSDLIKDSVREKLRNGEKSARMSRELVEIFRDAPVALDLEASDVRNLDPKKLRDELMKLEFNSLLRKLPDFMRHEGKSGSASGDHNFGNVEVKSFAKLSSKEKEDFAKKSVFVVSLLPENEKELLISADENLAYSITFHEFSEFAKGKKIISHNLKFLAEELLSRGFDVDFIAEFDTRQAAFLLNSARQSPDLEEAVNFVELDADNHPKRFKLSERIAATWWLYNKQKIELAQNPRLEHLAQTADFPLQILLAKIEKRGVKLDLEVFNKMRIDLAKQIREVEQTIWQMVGREFNISSAPQLSDALFKDLKLSSNGIKRSVRGYFSTGKKELDKLRGVHPIIEQIENARALLKLKNTYIDALPKLVDRNGYLHTTFRQDITSTGRLSSSAPNLQNIPTRTELGQEIRHGFVASEGKVLVSADYSQFELRLAAALAHDENMIEIFAKDDIDIHTQTASEAFGVPIDEVTPIQRRSAKVINFGVLYGMSPHGLSVATGMDFATAKKFIDRYFEIRRPIREFLDSTIKQAEVEGFVETLFGRRRPTPDVKTSNFMVREAAKRAAANMPIQGTEADLMKMAMLKIEQIPGTSQFMQIHDSIMVECEPESAEGISRNMKEIMENIYPALGVKLRVEIKTGSTWADL